MFVKEPRRVPAQERSRQRFERIFDAAATVFADQGFEAATMEAIAAKAETSIGSVYQFFPNKAALFNAIAARYREKVKELFDLLTAAGALEDRPWQEILETGIDAFAAFHENEPGFRAVWVSLHLTEQVMAEGDALNREFARRIEGILAKKLPTLPADKRIVTATMLVEIMTATLILAARRPRHAKEVIAEAKVVLRRYLAPYAGVRPRKPRSSGAAGVKSKK